MKIEHIKKLDNGKYKLTIDGKDIITYDDILIKYNILYKNDITPELYFKIQKDNNYYEIYNKVVSFIIKKRKSKKEIENYLNTFSLDSEDINSIIKKLQDIGLINDREYTRAYISDRLYLSNDGPNKIRCYLINQDIDLSIIDDELSKIDSQEIMNKLEKLVSKKIKSNHHYSSYKLKIKIKYDLSNLGYDVEDINSILNNYYCNNEEIIKKEYHKYYQRLMRKYSGEELIKQLKVKLLAKGFSANEIDSVINNE